MTDFEELYRMYFDDVYRYILRLSGNMHTAEEITSETFFKAMKNIGKFRGDCDVRVWLCQIAKNCYYSHIRKNEKNVSADETDLCEAPDPSADVAEEYAAREALEQIQTILHGINEPYKEVFWLRIFGELSFAQIGAIFDKTESWARVTYYRAKIMIKEELQ